MLATSQDVPSSFVDGPLQARLPKTDTVMEWKQSSGPFQYGNVVEEVQIYGIYHKEVSRQGRQEPLPSLFRSHCHTAPYFKQVVSFSI